MVPDPKLGVEFAESLPRLSNIEKLHLENTPVGDDTFTNALGHLELQNIHDNYEYISKITSLKRLQVYTTKSSTTVDLIILLLGLSCGAITTLFVLSRHVIPEDCNQ